MKKNTIIKGIFLLITIAFVVGAVIYFNNNDNDEDVVLNEVEGELISYDDDKFTILYNEDEYTFSTPNEVKYPENFDVKNIIKVVYVGDLDKELEIQDVEMKNIMVTKINDENEKLTRINKIIENMTLEEKVNQMFLVRVPDTNEVQTLADNQFGGYLLFGRDFEGKTIEQVTNRNNEYQSVSKIPTFLAVDEEGGTVCRVSKYLLDERYLSPQQLYNINGFESIKQDAYDKSKFLLELGLNLNLAPVADISTNPNDFIYDRTLGKDSSMTCKYVEVVVKAMNESKIGNCLKHFPGYGNNVDTHTGVANDKRPLTYLKDNDLLPFKAGIEAGADMVLVSHNIIESIDSLNPGSLSEGVHNLLRDELNFEGVIITDDLIMDGVLEYGTDAQIAIQAVKAGNDMLISSNAIVQSNAVIEAAKTGELSIEYIDKAVLRVLLMKDKLGMLENL